MTQPKALSDVLKDPAVAEQAYAQQALVTKNQINELTTAREQLGENSVVESSIVAGIGAIGGLGVGRAMLGYNPTGDHGWAAKAADVAREVWTKAGDIGAREGEKALSGGQLAVTGTVLVASGLVAKAALDFSRRSKNEKRETLDGAIESGKEELSSWQDKVATARTAREQEPETQR